MLVAHYPYPNNGPHPTYYSGGYGQVPESQGRGPLPLHNGDPSYNGSHCGGPITGPRSIGPHNGVHMSSGGDPSYNGSHCGGPITGPRSIGPHNGVHMSSGGGQIQGPINGVPLADSQNNMSMAGTQSMGHFPNPGNELLPPDPRMVQGYSVGAPLTSSQCGVPPANYTAHMSYTSHPPVSLDTGTPHSGHSFLGPPYHPYSQQSEPGTAYDNGGLCRPSHPVHQNQVYQGGNMAYPGYLQTNALPCPGDPGEQVTPKVEPDSTWGYDDELLDHFQQVCLQSDGTPPPRDSTKPRRKRRTSERRKENSRVAARCRRTKESKLFDELAGELPLPKETVDHLDKASVMRLTLAVLKTRALCQAGFSKAVEGSGRKLDLEMDGLLLKALDGFLLVLSTDGDIVYTSENIMDFLGLPQVDVMGQSLYEYTHQCDHDEVRELMTTRSPVSPRHAFLRFKCTLTAKGRSVNLKSASYKVVQVSGELVRKKEEQTWLVALATPVPHPSNIEFPLDKQTFVSKHSLDMKFTYVDENVGDFCGYVAEELVGKSLYEMHHALDSDMVKSAYKTLRSKGQVETGRYRFLARGGGYVWLVTQATLINGTKDHKPQYVVCLNYVISGVESKGEILSELQLKCSLENNNSNNKDNNTKQQQQQQQQQACVGTSAPPVVKDLATPARPPTHKQKLCAVGVPAAPRVITPAPPPLRPPVATTFKIFAPRTEDMNKGYLIFSEDDPQCTVLKEEPEDLTHLAPSGGDTCVPLLPLPLSPDQDSSCLPQEVTTTTAATPTVSPHPLHDMYTIDYQMPVENSDVPVASPVPDKAEERESSPKYLYEENYFGGIKCMNRLSGGEIVLRQSDCCSPTTDCRSQRPGSGLGTPEPPKPLLSEAALPLSHKKLNTVVLGGSKPRATTKSFFTHLDESHTQGSSPGIFGKLDLKPEDQNMDSDEFEMRAPYIPFSNEDLLLGPDDLLWGAEPEPSVISKHSAALARESRCCGLSDKEDSSLAQLLRDTDPPITGVPPHHPRHLHINTSASQRNQYYQHSKFLDGGGNFVDPNKVLPGHYAGKEDVEGGGGRSQLIDPPPILVQETVEPPPPLLPLDTNNHHHNQNHHTLKRGRSPLSSPTLTHKKLCSPPCQPNASPQPEGEPGGGGVRLLTTPYAPTMQQLLNVGGDHNVVVRDDGGGTPSLSLPVARDKMTAMLVTGGGSVGRLGGQLTHPKLRLVAGSGTMMPSGHLAFRLASSGDGGGGGRRGVRQDPLLLMNTDTTIPNLLELTQQDYEVNAPANNCSLLQGADLLMALDQSL